MNIFFVVKVVAIYFTDGNIDAPPSFTPAKKYSDVSGLPVSIFKMIYPINFWRGICKMHSLSDHKWVDC